MIKINERYKCIGDIIDEGLNALFRDLLQPELSLTGTYLDYFRANRQTTKSAQEDYYKNLKKWKNWFAVPCGLDRHKVAAVTAHYLIKHFPIVTIVNRSELNNVSSLTIINEVTTLFVAISRLHHQGVEYKLEKQLTGSFVQTFRKHSRVLGKFNNYAVSKEFHIL